MQKETKKKQPSTSKENKTPNPKTAKRALLLDASYLDENKESKIILYCADEKAKFWIKDEEFSPYLYAAVGEEEAKKAVKELEGYSFGDTERFCLKKAEITEAKINKKQIIKIHFLKAGHLIIARKILREIGYELYEYDIPYAKRYLLDKRLEPGNWIEYNLIEKKPGKEKNKKNNGLGGGNENFGLEEKGVNGLAKGNEKSEPGEKGGKELNENAQKEIFETGYGGEEEKDALQTNKEILSAKNIKPINGEFFGKAMAFDLETKTGKKFTIGVEPILMSSFVSNELGEKEKKEENQEKAVSYGTKKIKTLEILENEKELVKRIIGELNKKENSFIITYNGDNFDFSYVKERAKKMGLDFEINGAPVIIRRKGLENAVKLMGIQHIDSYQIIKFLARTGAVNLDRLDIETVSLKLFGEEKEKVFPKEINEAWETGDEKKLLRLVDYNIKDSRTAFRIAKEFIQLFIEISKLTSQTLYETTRSTTSQMVEDLLLKEAKKRNIIAPNKPKESEVSARTQNPIKGAFVKEPLAGLHEKMAVLDFASLYPSIITSHNISPETLNCGHEECKKNKSPDGSYFCTKKKGLFPEILQDLLKKRLGLKREYKRKKKQEGIEDKMLFAKQWALKIILNSVYGYLGYPRARWYSRECASATTAWERDYIQKTIEKAQKEGYKVLYGDSVTKERFVTIKNPKGLIEVKNIEELFNEISGRAKIIGEKEIKNPKGYYALSVDTAVRCAEWSKIKAVMRHNTQKRIYRINQKFGEASVTQDHSIIAEENYVLKKTKPLEMAGKKFFVVKQIPTAEEIKEIDLFEILKKYSYKRIYKNQNIVSKWHAQGNEIWFGFMNLERQITVKRFIKVASCEFESLCRLLGAYISEGSSSTLETSLTKFGASIASSNTKWLSGIQNDYNALFLNAKTSIIKSNKKERTLTYGIGRKTIKYFDNTHKLQMMNETSALFFRGLCGQKSAGKKIPGFIFNVPNKYKLLMLEKMIEGDGSRAVNKKLGYTKEYIEKNFSYTTKSLGLISGLSLLLRQLGRNFSINYRQSKCAYTLKTCDKTNSKFQTKTARVQYAGPVYDLSVEKNNNFVDSCGQILLHNTDSCFLLMLDKNKADVENFVEKINADLLGDMELEIEGFYQRGIFVTKKEGGAAKKRYALMDEKQNLKIVGFEYVRRDWCMLARETQKKVLELVLKKGKPEEAVEYVKKIIKQIKEGKVEKKDLAIMTILQREPEDYESIGPHVAAAKKAIKKGKELGAGSMLSFIITRGKNEKESISDKAQLEEYVKEGDYDIDYYIENQLIPAVLKIIQEFGYSKEDLITGGKQTGLMAWG